MTIPTIEHKGLSLINIKNPTQGQLAHLNKQFGFSLLNLEDYLYKTQIPKIETYDNYSLIVLDIPFIDYDKKSKHENDIKLSSIPNILTAKVPLPAFPKSLNRNVFISAKLTFLSVKIISSFFMTKKHHRSMIYLRCVKQMMSSEKN